MTVRNPWAGAMLSGVDIERMFSFGPVNVLFEDYGADPTGASDSTDAFLFAIDELEAREGGVVYAPSGDYRIDGEITVPPFEGGVRIVGDGAGWKDNARNRRITRLFRDLAGYADDSKRMIHGAGTAAERLYLDVEGVILDGNAGVGINNQQSLLHIEHWQFGSLERVFFRDARSDADGTPICLIQQGFNCEMNKVWMDACGSAGFFATPTDPQGAGMAFSDGSGDGTITMTCYNLEFEGMFGTDLWFGGSVYPCQGISVENVKMERGQVSSGGTAQPHILLGLCDLIQFGNLVIPMFRDNPAIRQFGTGGTSQFVNLAMTGSGGHLQPTHWINVEDGVMLISNAELAGGGGVPSTAYVRLGAACDGFSFDGHCDNPSILVEDLR